MPYTLHRLAAGSYDLLLDSAVIGDVVRDVSHGHVRGWHARLLEDLPPAQRPQPFIEIEHRFDALEEVLAWLGDAAITDNPERKRRGSPDRHGRGRSLSARYRGDAQGRPDGSHPAPLRHQAPAAGHRE